MLILIKIKKMLMSGLCPGTEKSNMTFHHFCKSLYPLSLFIAGIIIFSLTTCTDGEREVILVKNGKSTSLIVLPEDPSQEVREAGQEFQQYIEKCTGADLNIVREDQLGDKSLPDNIIYLGNCQKTGEVIDIENIKSEELVIRTSGSNLFITGRDGGTLYGVYYWLREYLGVRWIMPGELGEVTPHSSTVSVNNIDYRYQPVVGSRHLRNIKWSERVGIGIQRICEETGIENIEDSVKKVKEFYRSAPEAPFTRWGGGERIQMKHAHAFDDYWEKYGQEHPEFFALQPDGSREQDPKRARLCVSNPELWEFVAQRKIEEFRENPEQNMASISPNDGGPNYFCMCERCRSWDPQNAPKVSNSRIVNPETGEPYDEYPSLSDRYFKFYNKVAERVAEVYPDKKLGVYAYSVYKTVPVSIDKLHSMLNVELITLEKDLIGEWSKITGKGQLGIRPNTIAPMYKMGFASNTARWHAERIRYAVEKGALGFDFDASVWNWGTDGLEYYVLVHMMWKPSADVDQLIDDYCRAAYDSGADAMRKYFDRLETVTTSLREEGRYKGLTPTLLVLPEYYTEEVLSELQGYIDEAKSSVGDNSSKQYKRIRVVETGLKYTQLANRVIRILGTTENYSDDPRYQNAEKDFYRFLSSNLSQHSFNTGYVTYYFFRVLDYYKTKMRPNISTFEHLETSPSNR
jgi:hypothetical protein